MLFRSEEGGPDRWGPPVGGREKGEGEWSGLGREREAGLVAGLGRAKGVKVKVKGDGGGLG